MKMGVMLGGKAVRVSSEERALLEDLLDEIVPGVRTSFKELLESQVKLIKEGWPRPGYKDTTKKSTGLSYNSFEYGIFISGDQVLGRIYNSATKGGSFKTYAYMIKANVTNGKNTWKLLGLDPIKSPEFIARLQSLFNKHIKE